MDRKTKELFEGLKQLKLDGPKVVLDGLYQLPKREREPHVALVDLPQFDHPVMMHREMDIRPEELVLFVTKNRAERAPQPNVRLRHDMLVELSELAHPIVFNTLEMDPGLAKRLLPLTPEERADLPVYEQRVSRWRRWYKSQ